MSQLPTTVDRLVKSSNQLARGRKVRVDSLDASRVLASLVAAIQPGDQKEKLYQVDAASVIPTTDGKAYAAVKKVCATLGGSFVEVESTGKSGPVFEVVPIFALLRYESGVISCRFNELAAPHLFDLSALFTSYRLVEFLALGSRYAQALFEILRSWDDRPEKTIPLEELHRVLNVPPSLKKTWKDFQRRVLETAEKEILEHTSLRFKWEPMKEKRRVVAVRFIFETPSKKPSRKPVEAPKIKTQDKAHEREKIAFLRCTACRKKNGNTCPGPGKEANFVCKACKEKFFQE